MNLGGLNDAMNKIKGFFTKTQKEILDTGDGKRNLYFDYERKYYIKFGLDVSTTCELILKIHKSEIMNAIKIVYRKDIPLDNFGFFIVELNANKYNGTQNLINVRLRKDDNNNIFKLLSNSQLMICFLLVNKHNLSYKKNVRNLGLLNPINFEKIETEENQKNNTNKNIKIYLSKGSIYFYNYNSYSFSKEKIIITEKEIFISSSPSYRLLIKDIKLISFFISTFGNDEKKYLANYTIHGDKPVFCLEIKSKVGKSLLIGRNSYDSCLSLQRELETAFNDYQNHFYNFDFDGKINQYNVNIFSLSNSYLISNSSIDNLVIHRAKRKILFKDFKETELIEIVNNIMEFRNNLYRKRYLDSINNIKNLMDLLNKLLQEKKYQDVINEKNTDCLKQIWNKINEANLLDKEINEINEVNEKENMLSEEKIKQLHNIININSFDPLYFEIKQKYISPFYEQKISDKKGKNTNDKLKLKLILGNYIANNLEMKQEKDFLYLGGDELEKTINDFNNELIAERFKNPQVL